MVLKHPGQVNRQHPEFHVNLVCDFLGKDLRFKKVRARASVKEQSSLCTGLGDPASFLVMKY